MVLELGGVSDILFKFLGLNILINMVCVIFNGLVNLKCVEDVVKLCGKIVEELLG